MVAWSYGGDLAAGLIADDVAQEVRARDPALRKAQLQRTAVAVRVRRHVAAGHEGAEVVLEVAAEQSEHPARLAVEPAPEAEHLVLAGGGLGEAQGGLHGLGAPGEELDAGEPLRREARQLREEAGARLGREAAERQALELPLERFHVMRMAVTDAAHADAGDEVDVLVAVLIDQRATLATGHRHAGREGEGLQPGRDMTSLLGDDVTRPRSDLAALRHRAAPAKRKATCAAIRSAASSR